MSYNIKSIAGFFLISLLFISCGNIPSTDEINSDINNVNEQILEAKKESDLFKGGLIKNMIDLRIEVLKNTKAMLEQKMKGINRYISIKYKIDGKVYNRPGDFEQRISSINEDIKQIKATIAEAQLKSNQYRGGLLKTMLEVNIATLKTSLTFLELKKMGLKHDIPVYVPELPGAKSEKPIRKPMKGSDLDNL